jgi:soluble lytic murein transglycosylase-like protein
VLSRNKTAAAALGVASLVALPPTASAADDDPNTLKPQAEPSPELVATLKADQRHEAHARRAEKAKAKLVRKNAALAKALKKERGKGFSRTKHLNWVEDWSRGRLKARNAHFSDKLEGLRSVESGGGAITATGGGSGEAGSGSAPSGQLAAIAACESGGDPGAVGGGGAYRGKYQFSPSTWASVGGSGDPAAAPEAEQDQRAAMLLARDGAGHWPVCG